MRDKLTRAEERYNFILEAVRRRNSPENREPVRLGRQEMVEFFAGHPELLAAALDRTPSPEPPLPIEEPMRSQAIIVRSAAKRGINICFLGAGRSSQIRPPVDDGAA